MANPVLGIMALYLSGNKLEERSLFRRFTVQGARLGLKVVVFTPEDVNNERIFAHVFDLVRKRWVRRWVSFPDVIFDRCRYQPNERFAQLKRFREKYPNLTYLNRPMANKWSMYQLLQEHEDVNPHLPETRLYRQIPDLAEFLKRYELVYLKPKNGTGGRGILRIERIDRNAFLVEGRKQDRAIIDPARTTLKGIASKLAGWELKDKYLVQQGIDLRLTGGRVHDYRLLMQKDGNGEWTVTGCAGRVGASRSVTSNLHGGGEAVEMPRLLGMRFDNLDKIEAVREEMYLLGFKVVDALQQHFSDMCELALDIAVDFEGHPWLLEVNPKPAREVFNRIGERNTYRNAITRPLEYALWVYQNRGDQIENVSN